MSAATALNAPSQPSAPAQALPEFLDEPAFTAWVAQALPGERLVYYRGHLGHDRMPTSNIHPEPVRRQLTALARCAMTLAEDGFVVLIQERLGSASWAYIAVRKHSASCVRSAAHLLREHDEREAA